MSKGMRALVAACCLCLLALAAPHVADWYHRHYGMGISDRMNIRVALNGVLLPPSEYSLTYAPDGGYEPATATESGYSIGSDYGVYALSVDLNGREITLVVENVDNWWRTDILLDITRRDDGSMFVAATLDVINDEDQTPETREWIIERKFHE